MNMSSFRMPSLRSLQVFEALIRAGDPAKAAYEFNVTPGAIHYQIRALEANLGVILFERRSGTLSPTPRALELARRINLGLDQISESVKSFVSQGQNKVLTVSTDVTFGSLWLGPRVAAFEATHPDLKVQLDLADYDTNFYQRGVDVSIRLGNGDFPDCCSALLFREEIYPVISPALSRQLGVMKPSDLGRCPLIHVEWYEPKTLFRTFSWERWFQITGAASVPGHESGIFVSHTNLALRSVCAGLGAALASDCLVGDLLLTGGVERPFRNRLKVPRDYYVVWAARDSGQRRINVFCEWLLEEAASFLSAVNHADDER